MFEVGGGETESNPEPKPKPRTRQIRMANEFALDVLPWPKKAQLEQSGKPGNLDKDDSDSDWGAFS